MNIELQKTETSKILNSTPITCNSEILQLLCDIQTNNYLENKISPLSCLIQILTNLFGKPNKVMRLEKMTSVWVLSYDNLLFNIFTAKEKGTSIEIVGDYEIARETKRIKNFLKTFNNLINQ